jgi:asparagine synthase (glutamine-hydrolysing)
VSGICGVVGTDGRRPSEADLAGVVRALAGLGGDGGGAWAGDAGRCGVAVAATLRRSTPEDAADRQPAMSADGSLVLVGDLRLDNRDELAAALPLDDRPSVPDSAFVLRAYERWGHGMPERLHGEFALALVDRTRGGVLLARDHVGARPLVTHERRGEVAFASNALALTHLEGVEHRLDVARAAEVLALAYASERTFVEGVRWVPAATAVWIGDSGARRWAWWRPDPERIVDLGSPEAHERELREAIEVAVAARLRSAGAVAAGVSGGLDSTSVAATAARLLAPERLATYTSAPPPEWDGHSRAGRDADESPLVIKLAELHPNMAPSFVHLRPGESVFAFQEPLWERGAGPGRNPENILWVRAILARAGAAGATTLLEGARGNMCFSADGPDWLVALARRGRLITALREAAAWGRASGDGTASTLARRLAFPMLPRPLRQLARRLTGRPVAERDWLEATALRREVFEDLGLLGMLPGLDEQMHPRRLALFVAQAGATQADVTAALAAVTGVEQRDPTVDRRVLEVAIRQPEWVRRHDGVTRAVVRGAMADRLPHEIVDRTVRGEQLPDWLDVLTAARDELAAELDQLIEHPTSRELIDTDRLRRLFDHWPERSASGDFAVVRDYRLALLRALHVSRYLRWFESRAA